MTGRRGVLAGAVLLAAFALLCVVALLRPPLPLPVSLGLGLRQVVLGGLQGTAAVLVPVALVGLLAALRGAGAIRRPVAVVALGAAQPIVVLIVARLNGVADVAALVLVYAATAGSVLLLALQRPGGSPLPMRLESVLGIVPWGVVALAQVGGGIAGDPPSLAVRVLTLLVLAASIAGWIAAYRRRDAPASEAVGLVRAAVPALLLAAGTVLAVG